MKEVTLQAHSRSILGKQVKALRRQGRLPAVIYGKGIAPISISLDMREAGRILPTISSSHLLTIDVDGTPHTTLVRERQKDPVTSSLVHVDFLEVSLTEKLRTVVSIHLEGESPAVKTYSGIVVLAQEEVEVEAFPQDLPSHITVNISSLENIGDTIHVRDLVVSPKVRIFNDPDEIIVNVTGQDYDAAAAAGLAETVEPEVIERGKKEEDF